VRLELNGAVDRCTPADAHRRRAASVTRASRGRRALTPDRSRLPCRM